MDALRTSRASVEAAVGLAAERLRRAPQHVVLALLLQALVLFVVGQLLPGVIVADAGAALLTALVLALLNALVRPLLVLLTLPLSVASFGLASLLINATMVVLAAPLVPGLEVHGFLAAFSLALVLSVATTIVNVTLSVGEDETFYAELARRIGRDTAGPADRSRPGLVIVQIDGLSAPVLGNAIRVGLVPRMAAWVRSGRYRLNEWECPPPAQTSASQAGILHGRNDDIPGFRWYEKESGRLMVSNRPADAAEIERRVSTGDGLLHPGGASVGNLLSGDAAQSAFTLSRMTDPTGALDLDAFALYFVDPAAFVRTVVLTIGEVAKELLEALRQRRADIEPRVHRGATFAVLRAVTNVVMRDLDTAAVVRAMTEGVPVIYVDYADYDEVAHHAGPERLESLRTLAGVDQVIASLERAAGYAGRDYTFVVLSDHGQSQGATFRQLSGRTLEAVLRDLMRGQPEVVAATGRTEAYGPVNALLSELTQRPGVAGRATGRALRGRMREGGVELAPRREPGARPRSETRVPPEGAAEGIRPELVVCASGNLANVYFADQPGRLTAEDIEARHPGLLGGLAAHRGIGFVMVRAASGSALVLGPKGVRHLGDGVVDGIDPLAGFGARSPQHLGRLDTFADVGDLLVNSTYDRDLGEVAAFEELVGSHGEIGGPQNRPFLLHPQRLALDEDELVGPVAVHHQLRAWIQRLGVDPGAADEAPAASGREPKGMVAVVAYVAVVSALLVAAGLFLVAFALWGDPGARPPEVGGMPGLVGLVLAALGALGLVTAVGLQRRRRWARTLTLALEGVAVVAVVFALASGNVHGLMAYGLGLAIVALGILLYLTRPHVAADFGQAPGRERGSRAGR